MTITKVTDSIGNIGDSPYLSSNDICDYGDVAVEMVDFLKLSNESVAGRTIKERAAVVFRTAKGTQLKPMILNATNKTILKGLCGTLSAPKLKGQCVYIHVEKIDAFGKSGVDALRFVRDKRPPKQVNAARQPQQPIDDNRPELLPEGTPIISTATRLENYRIAINYAATAAECDALIEAEVPHDETNPHRYTQEQQREIVKLFNDRVAFVSVK